MKYTFNFLCSLIDFISFINVRIYFYNKKLKKKRTKIRFVFLGKKFFTSIIFIIIYHLFVKLHKHPLYHLSQNFLWQGALSFHPRLWIKILLLGEWPNILHPRFPSQFHGLNIPLSDPYNVYRVYQTRKTLDQELVNFWKISKPQISRKSFLPKVASPMGLTRILKPF